jgi:hypothetical protein
VKVPIQNKVHVLEEQMRPQSLEEIEVLEKHIAGALRDLQEQKVKFQQRSK